MQAVIRGCKREVRKMSILIVLKVPLIPKKSAPHGSIAILIFHDGVAVPSLPKLNTSWRFVAVVPEFGTFMYTVSE